ncbi:MAG TPA: hypothetical protein VG226_03720, partial [Acidimicrobiales bacterium]|nr:hypothetical protein [Acidimicrobiales bacterium]
IMAILRAESLWEIPVLGRLLAVGAEKRMQAARRETDEAIAESLAGANRNTTAAGDGTGLAANDGSPSPDGSPTSTEVTNVIESPAAPR